MTLTWCNIQSFFLFFFFCLFIYFTDISEIESYRSYSPTEDRRGHVSDLSSHSSNERLRDKPRWDVISLFCIMWTLRESFIICRVVISPFISQSLLCFYNLCVLNTVGNQDNVGLCLCLISSITLSHVSCWRLGRDLKTVPFINVTKFIMEMTYFNYSDTTLNRACHLTCS